jgi:YcaO-like protein with predicted kinase domain
MINRFEFVEQIQPVRLPGSCPYTVFAAVLKADRWGRKRVVSGRGTGPEEALRNCLAEAAERWCAIFDENQPGVWATERDMAQAAISPQSLLLISDRQYENAEKWNSETDGDHHLPKRRDPNQPIFWVEADSLTKNSKVLVPAAYCYLGYPLAGDQGFPVPDSSGLAAGENQESCVVRGLFELVERDAVSIWWYGRIARPAAQIDREKLRLLADIEKWFETQGRKFWLLDLTTDLELPVLAAISCDETGKDPSFGYSAGWTKAEAARGAMGELIQFEATKGLTSRREGSDRGDFLGWCLQARVTDQPHLLPSPSAEAELPARITRNVPSLVGLLNRKGIEVIVRKLNRDHAPFSVTRVIAPGLRPIWPRFAPGRLYDVPTELRWRSCRLQESELNSVSIIY